MLIFTIQERVIRGALAPFPLAAEAASPRGALSAGGLTSTSRIIARSCCPRSLVDATASVSAQDFDASFSVAPQKSHVPDALFDSGAPQVGQWADDTLLPTSLRAPAWRASTRSRCDTAVCSCRLTVPSLSVLKRVADQATSMTARS